MHHVTFARYSSPGSCASDCCNLLAHASKLRARNRWKKYCSEELKTPHVLPTSIFETTGERWRTRLLRCTRTFSYEEENYITTCRTKSAPKMINMETEHVFPLKMNGFLRFKAIQIQSVRQRIDCCLATDWRQQIQYGSAREICTCFGT